MKGELRIAVHSRVFIDALPFSSSKGNSEEETNSNGGDQFVDCAISPHLDDAKNYEESTNRDSVATMIIPEPNV